MPNEPTILTQEEFESILQMGGLDHDEYGNYERACKAHAALLAENARLKKEFSSHSDECADAEARLLEENVQMRAAANRNNGRQ